MQAHEYIIGFGRGRPPGVHNNNDHGNDNLDHHYDHPGHRYHHHDAAAAGMPLTVQLQRASLVRQVRLARMRFLRALRLRGCAATRPNATPACEFQFFINEHNDRNN